MAKYRVLEKSFIGGAVVEVDSIVDYDGEAGANLAPVKGKKAAPSTDQGTNTSAGDGSDSALV